MAAIVYEEKGAVLVGRLAGTGLIRRQIAPIGIGGAAAQDRALVGRANRDRLVERSVSPMKP
jgi:hypothetical protein